jgi:alpha-glucosidase (family GH31 glycosyl hydrolase)
LCPVNSFGYGSDYKGALFDFTQIAGKIAMVPRYASGIWWTRWYDLNSADIVKVVSDFESRSIPLDVFILDMVRVAPTPSCF